MLLFCKTSDLVPQKEWTGQLLLMTQRQWPGERLGSRPQSFLGEEEALALIQIIKCSFQTSTHYTYECSGCLMKLCCLSEGQAILVLLTGMRVGVELVSEQSRQVSLKQLRAINPQGLAGYSGERGCPVQEVDTPKSYIRTIGEQLSSSSEIVKSAPVS